MAIHAVTTTLFPSPCAIQVNFAVSNAKVSCVEGHPFLVSSTNEGTNEPNGYIQIVTLVTIEDYDLVIEARRYARPIELAVLGVLSYLSGCVFAVSDRVLSQSTVIDEPPLDVNSSSQSPELIVNGADMSNDVKLILNNIDNIENRSTIISLIDRWRRSRFLLLGSVDRLHHKEAFLGFFHILELLLTEYDKQHRAHDSQQIDTFVNEFLQKNRFLRGQKFRDDKSLKIKSIKEIFMPSGMVPASTRIHYMIEKMGILELRTHRLITDLVEVRNELAHGRFTFRQGMVWPLAPFFSIISQHSCLTEILDVFTARVIALHYGIGAW